MTASRAIRTFDYGFGQVCYYRADWRIWGMVFDNQDLHNSPRAREGLSKKPFSLIELQY